MSWSHSIRQIHRWLAVFFTVAVIVTFIALGQENPAAWVSYLPLLPLACLQLTGLYMLVQPWLSRRRQGQLERTP